MEKINFDNYEEGRLSPGSIKTGFVYKGKFYELGSQELASLLETEGQKEENKNTLLGLIADVK